MGNLTVALLAILMLRGVPPGSLARIEIDPAQPTESDVIRIVADGSMPTPCYDVASTVSVIGQRISIAVELRAGPGYCIQVLGNWRVAHDVGPLPAGTYHVIVDVGGLPWPPQWQHQEAELLVKATASSELDAPLCPCDCDGDASVTVDELTFGINVLLGSRSSFDCPAFDPPALDRLIRAVGHALSGCPPPIVADVSGFDRFTILHGPGLGFCPRLGSVLAATIVREDDGTLTLKRTRAESGDAAVDHCLFPEFSSYDCVVSRVEPCRTLSAGDAARVQEVFGSIGVLPGPVYGCGFEDPCLTTRSTWDEIVLADGACARLRLGDAELARLLALLDSLDAGAERPCPAGLCGPGNFVFCSDGNDVGGDGWAADCSEESAHE